MGVTSVTIPSSVISIDTYAFRNNQIVSVAIPSSVTSIGSYAFYTNKIPQGDFIVNNIATNISIGSYALNNNGTNGTTTITPVYVTPGNCFAFNSTTGMITDYYDYIDNNYSNPACPRDVVIPEKINDVTVVSIEVGTFWYSYLTSVKIPYTVSSFNSGYSVCDNPFYNIPTLTSIVVDSRNATYTSVNNMIYTKDGKTLVSGIKGGSNSISSTVTDIVDCAFAMLEITSATIPSGVINIGTEAFSGNLLTSISIPSSVTNMGSNPFDSNPTLTTLTVDSSNTKYMSSNNAVYTKDAKTLVFGAKTSSNNILSTTTSISTYAFYRMGLTSLTIPSGVIYIWSNAFSANQLTSLTIPNTVTYISSSSFNNNLLTSVTIPSNVMSLGTYAFYGNKLTSLYIKGKSSSSQFSTYGSYIWGWASGYSDSNITWNAP